jgi:predicted dienelactone hydrolase
MPIRTRSRSTRARRRLLPALLFAPTVLLAQGVTGVGFHAIRIHDPVNGGTMPGYVFYPTAQAGSTWVGEYHVAATTDAPATPGVRPLVVISHGHGGSDLGHHDLATYLASHGFVVATLEHPKDNFHDMSGNGHATVLGGRPIQVSATISMLLDDPRWKRLIDPDRIGVTGFSAGGYTSLLVVGAVPRFDRIIGYCHRHPEDKETCGLAKHLLANADGTEQSPENYLAALQHDITKWGRTADPRVKAAFVMAPFSLVFDSAGAASIDRPVFLYYGEHDEVLLPSENARHVAPFIRTLVGIKMVPGAGHYIFLAPCSAALAKEIPDLCTDPPGVDRTAVHARVDADALEFFRKTLHIASDTTDR